MSHGKPTIQPPLQSTSSNNDPSMTTNPYSRQFWSLEGQQRLQRQNPVLAATLRAESKAARLAAANVRAKEAAAARATAKAETSAPGYNPFLPGEMFNIMEQMRITQRDPARARALCEAAGHPWLGGK